MSKKTEKPLKPLVRDGGFLPSDKWTPLVYPGGKTTLNQNSDLPKPAPRENSKAEGGNNADS